jgi:hypothetical protein
MKSKYIILISSCEIIALKFLVSQKNEINDFSKKMTLLKDCYRCVLPNIVVKINRHSIYSVFQK